VLGRWAALAARRRAALRRRTAFAMRWRWAALAVLGCRRSWAVGSLVHLRARLSQWLYVA